MRFDSSRRKITETIMESGNEEKIEKMKGAGKIKNACCNEENEDNTITGEGECI